MSPEGRRRAARNKRRRENLGKALFIAMAAVLAGLIATQL